MSADRYEINDADHGAIRISHPSAHLPHEFVCIHPGADPWSAFSNGVIRQQSRDIKLLTQMLHDQRLVIDDLEHRRVKVCDENDQLRTDLAAAVAERDSLRAECDLLTHKVICCGVAAWHSDPLLTTTGAYAGKWNSPQADCVRKLRAERDQLRTDLAAAVAERDEARTAYQVRNTEWHQHELIALALAERYKLRAEQAEARLAAIEVAPMVARVVEIKRDFASGPYRCLDYDSDKLPGGFVELIARPAKDQE